MRRKYSLIAVSVSVALIIVIFVRDDEPKSPEEAVVNEAPSVVEPKEDLRGKESPKHSPVSNLNLNPLPVGPTKFKNGNLELFIDFADSSLSTEQKHRISQDLNSVFSHLDARLVQHGDQKKLVFDGQGRSWPDSLDHVRILRSINGRDSLYVDNSLSGSYKQAFDFIEQHGIDEAEVAELLDSLASGESSITDVAVLSLQSVPSEKLEEVLKDMLEGKIKQPSVLAYQIIPKGEPDAVFAETLFLELEKDVITYAEVIGVVRINGDWKIAL
jgi:hypothetical protein